uniref:Uncharacterized protein n=1 Tax=Salix viminalis TaxID=40686 RepID=A0A6N2KJ42_SALVM
MRRRSGLGSERESELEHDFESILMLSIGTRCQQPGLQSIDLYDGHGDLTILLPASHIKYKLFHQY